MLSDYLKNKFSKGRSSDNCVGSAADSSALLGDGEFSLLKLLQGTWESKESGWNLIALPVGGPNQYRLLMNQYGERLTFLGCETNVPNRGVKPDFDGETSDPGDELDQFIDAIMYEQIIKQVESVDFPASNLRSNNGATIHREPGFMLQLLNHLMIGHTEEEGEEDGPDVKLSIARMGSVPHGNSFLAMGSVQISEGPPVIEDEDAMPERLIEDINHPYLAPYKCFQDQPFLGSAGGEDGFPGLFPKNANAILQFAASKLGNISKTWTLNFDTKFKNGQLPALPISNISFINREADTTEVHSTFWVMEVDSVDGAAPPEYFMQYSQTVYLEFFDPFETGKRVRWPHVSINTLRRTG